jgi:hypothetical protein
MTASCPVIQMARELRAQLQAQDIPGDFDPKGAYWEVMLEVRYRFTNYGALLKALPSCPLDCPIAAQGGGPIGAGCFNYDLAQDMLRTDARWLALRAFEAWQTHTGVDDANREQ